MVQDLCLLSSGQVASPSCLGLTSPNQGFALDEGLGSFLSQ